MKHFLLFCIGLLSLKSYAQGSLETDRQALIALYNSTNGAGWQNKTGWIVPGAPGDNPCSWYGITCGGGRVTELDMSYNLLTGYIPSAINNLSRLTKLNLSHNSLNSTYSASPNLSGIPSSAVVDISYNNFNFAGMAQNMSILDVYAPQANLPMIYETLPLVVCSWSRVMII